MANKNLQQFWFPTTERGIPITITFCARTWKDVCTVLNITMYKARNHVSQAEPKDEVCVKNPYSRYAYFNSGELCYAKPEKKGLLYKFIDLQSFINEYRKVYRTYEETLKNFSHVKEV